MNEQEQTQITIEVVKLIIQRLNKAGDAYYLIQPNEQAHIWFYTLANDNGAIFSESNISCIYAFLRGMLFVLD